MRIISSKIQGTGTALYIGMYHSRDVCVLVLQLMLGPCT